MSEAKEPHDQLVKRVAAMQNIILMLIAVVLLMPFVMLWYFNQTTNPIRSIQIDNVQIVSGTVLCPGDRLIVAFDYAAVGTGVMVEDATWFRVTPPATIIPSEEVRYILPYDFGRTVHRTWTVPSDYVDEQTGEAEPLQPGEYLRNFTLSSDVNGSVNDTVSFAFIVPDNCRKEDQ